MPKEFFIDYENFKLGLYALEDTTKAPFGTARTMKNMQITDRGGIGPRPGTLLLGTENTSASGVKGFYNFKKSYDADEFLIKGYDDELEVYSKNHPSAGWWRLKNGFTANKEFGFVSSLVNVDAEDYVVFCNRYEEYQRWLGAVTLLNGALVGAESAVTVDSVLTDEIFESKTASSASATTVTVAGTPWAADQWINLYIYITSGTHVGKIRLITDNTDNDLTFDTLGTSPGTATFEIRKNAFPASGDLIYNGTTIAYTAIPTATTFTVSSAHAADDDSAVTLVPTVYPANPRGNRLTNYLGRIIVGNVRSAMALDSGGALQGFNSAGSYFVSKIQNPFDFTYSAARVAGEGDIVNTPYGGGDINDVAHQEDTAYIFKGNYIESVKYSQDANDFAVRVPLKAETGAVGRVIKGSDDVYFVTEDNKITSLGRVLAKDITPQTENLGLNIKRIIKNYVFTQGRGIEHEEKLYIPARSSSSITDNDVIIVYNRVNKAYEGIWDMTASGFQRFNGKLYMSESNGANVLQMLVGNADVFGDERFPITSEYASQFLNLTHSKGDTQAMSSMFYEGYISAGSEVIFKVWKDFSDNPFLEFTFTGNEDDLLDGSVINASLGGAPFALRPLGSIGVGEEDAEGRRHFYFRAYFPFQYGNHFSVGFESAGADLNYEITRIGLGLKESVSVDTGRIKSVT